MLHYAAHAMYVHSYMYRYMVLPLPPHKQSKRIDFADAFLVRHQPRPAAVALRCLVTGGAPAPGGICGDGVGTLWLGFSVFCAVFRGLSSQRNFKLRLPTPRTISLACQAPNSCQCFCLRLLFRDDFVNHMTHTPFPPEMRTGAHLVHCHH